MFDTVVGSVSFQPECYLYQPVNSSPDTEVKVKGNGKLAAEIRLERSTEHVAKGSHKGMDCDVGTPEICRAVEIECSDSKCSRR